MSDRFNIVLDGYGTLISGVAAHSAEEAIDWYLGTFKGAMETPKRIGPNLFEVTEGQYVGRQGHAKERP